MIVNKARYDSGHVRNMCLKWCLRSSDLVGEHEEKSLL